MKNATQAFKDLIWDPSGDLVPFDLFTIALPAPYGTQRWTSYSTDVTVGATTWSATAPAVDMPRGMSDLGLALDARDVMLGGTFTIGGKTLQQIAREGAFDQKAITWEQAMAGSGAIVDKVIRFAGVVINAQPTSKGIRLRVKSGVALLDEEILSRVYGPTCPWAFKSTSCGYAGAETACNHTIDRCVALGNEVNFGGHALMPGQGIVDG